MCLEHEPSSLPSEVALDNLWVFGYVLYTDPCPSWSSFIKVVMRNERYETSRLLTLPFINLDPGNVSTIYTVVYFAQTQCEKYGLRVCPVTFDQPLYIKTA